MNAEKLKQQIGNTIAALRRQENMTQAELAQKLNYTDKAVSKWERGESVPDALTLVQLAELFGVGIDVLLGNAEVPKTNKKPRPKADRGVIQKLCSLLVWFVALTVYVVLSSSGVQKTWVVFFYAVPANAIVLLSLRSAFRMFSWNHALVSVIVWGVLLSVYMTLLLFAGVNVWRIFLLGILGQAAVTLWFRLFRSMEKHDG